MTKNELKSPVLIGKLLLERKMEVTEGRCLRPLGYSAHSLISHLPPDVRRAHKGANVWVQQTLHSSQSHWSANEINNNNNTVNSS